MNEEYYIIEDDQKKGPYTFSEIMQMDIDIHTEVITGANDTPQYASELSEFNEYFERKGIYFPTEDNLASFGKRAGAFLIDYLGWYLLLSNIISRTTIIVLPTNYRIGDPVPPEMFKLSLLMLGSFLIYNTICEATGLKGSLGKKILRLMVVDIDGQRLSVPRAFLRNLGVVLSITIWIPFLSVLFSEHRQAWYDSWAKTYVIKTN
ncbi:MAG TPA: RDD family protein [Mucilaginibacter sp.]|jgi:uncharacterized RDD family membrane protein YckC